MGSAILRDVWLINKWETIADIAETIEWKKKKLIIDSFNQSFYKFGSF